MPTRTNYDDHYGNKEDVAVFRAFNTTFSLNTMAQIFKARTRTLKALLCLTLCFFLAALPKSGMGLEKQARPVGYVLTVIGAWLLNGAKKIEQGQAVRPGDIIHLKTPGRDTSIRVSLYSGEVISCPRSSSEVCKNPITIPAVRQPSPAYRRIIKAVAKLFGSDERDKFNIAYAISRGQSLQESVLKLDGDRIDMTLLLSGIDGGTYTLIFEPQALEGKSASAPEATLKITIPEEVTEPLVFPAERLQLGLYRVVKTDNRADAWVLVAQAEKYGATAAAFDEALRLTKGWKAEVEPAEKRRALRAWLYHLAAAGSDQE
jgi:hypothetical protein